MNDKTPTPITDSAEMWCRPVDQSDQAPPNEQFVYSHVARELEVKLSEAKFSAEHRKHLLDGAIFHREKAEKELAEWKDCAEKLADIYFTHGGQISLSDEHIDAISLFNRLTKLHETHTTTP